MARSPVPPFTEETARRKVRLAEDAWNSRDPQTVALAYTEDSRWRNRVEFIEGRAEIEAFLTRKWARELDYRLIKETMDLRGRSDRSSLRLRVSRRQWSVVSSLRQRELGVRPGRADAPAYREHQRPSDRRRRAQVPLAGRTSTG